MDESIRALTLADLAPDEYRVGMPVTFPMYVTDVRSRRGRTERWPAVIRGVDGNQITVSYEDESYGRERLKTFAASDLRQA